MEYDPTSASARSSRILGGAASTNAARYIARERQKEELRRERDTLLLDLARDLGEQGLATRLGVTAPAIDRLLAGAQERLAGGASPRPGPDITVRRLRPDPDRWAQADAHYEALGSGPALTDLRDRASTPAR